MPYTKADYQGRRMAAGQTGTDWGARLGEFIGTTLLTAPLLAIPGAGEAGLIGAIGRGAATGAAAGAVSGAVEPVTGGDYTSGKAKQIATGAGTGLVTGGALGGAAHGVGATGVIDRIPGIRRVGGEMEGMRPSDAGQLLRRPDRLIEGEIAKPPAGLNAWQKGQWQLANHLYGEFEKHVPSGAPVGVSHIRDTLRALVDEGHGPEDPIVARLMQKLGGKNALSFGDLKALRTEIGMPRGYAQRQIRDALTDDMRIAARQQGPEALDAFDRATANYQRFRTLSDRLKKLTNAPDETAAFRRLYRAATRVGDNPKLLTTVKSVMPPQDWQDLSAAVTRQLGEGAREGKFSLATFGRNYDKLSDSAKDALFGPRGTDVRDGLERLSKSAIGWAATQATKHPFIATGLDLGAIGTLLLHAGTLPTAAIRRRGIAAEQGRCYRQASPAASPQRSTRASPPPRRKPPNRSSKSLRPMPSPSAGSTPRPLSAASLAAEASPE